MSTAAGTIPLTAVQRAIAARMSEAELQRLVESACERYGLLCYHTHDSRRSQPGYPDCTIVGSEVIWRELKSRDGRLTPEQRRWGSRITRAGGDWAVWRPDDWLSGRVVQLLASISPYAREPLD